MAGPKHREPPKPEDARPLHDTKGDVPEGMVRAEVIKRCWASNNKRLFAGDVVDLSEADFELLNERNFVKAQWKPSLKK
ncbi:MAG: hypothetical protein Q8L53_16770 [Aestuariivirga sp.]|nr:hypothetical protein [Aestuariivirga sp.]